jgi:hypothetical protein
VRHLQQHSCGGRYARRGGYGPSDYDRTYVFIIDYHYELPKFASTTSVEGKFLDGWSVQGLITIQSRLVPE